ncbi:MAG: DUF58 domain-containing protein [Planctomycetes bacterium]|nr:DUF58 domain-containing protein [Planctomycetota bacterium]
MAEHELVSDAFDGALLEALAHFELNLRTLTSSGVRGERRSRRRGGGTEYADHRQYAHGDDLRRLDWHALARLDQMLIRLYAADEALPLEVVMDASASMDFGAPTKFVTGARVGACLTQMALSHNTPARWRIALGKTHEPLSLKGRGELPKLLRALDETVPDGKGAMEHALRDSVLQGPRKRALIAITDGYDAQPLQHALRAVRGGGAEVGLVLVLAPEETNPQERGEYTLIDSESEAASRMTIDGAAIKRYRRMLASFREGWTDFCRTHGLMFVEISSDTPIDAALFRTLASSGMIG